MHVTSWGHLAGVFGTFSGRGPAPLGLLVDAACFTPVDQGNPGEC
ncbi:MAG TPA: hypothetical protein VFG88_03565 [Nocardioidaceae bacterium]|nr:hypothetical protein [Nocardioidaceae bacterium]